MATASRAASGAYTTLYTNVMEKWYNEDRAQDIVFKSRPSLNVLFELADVKTLPHDVTVRLLESKGEGVDSYEYYDTVSTANFRGAQAARFEVAQYSGPVGMSEQEELEFTSDEAIADAIKTKVHQQELTIADRLARDIFRGNSANAKNINGLEDLFLATTHLNSSDATASSLSIADFSEGLVFRTRQHAGVYGGITRTPFTADEIGGTGWEAPTIDFFDAAANGFTITSDIPNAGLEILTKAYYYASYGLDHPDLLICSPGPYDDYERALQAHVRMTRDTAAFGDAEFAFANMKFKDAVLVRDEFAPTYLVQGDETAGSGNVYGINTRHTKLLIDPRQNMRLSMPRMPFNQHSAVRFIQCRLQMISTSPRTGFRIFNYTARTD